MMADILDMFATDMAKSSAYVLRVYDARDAAHEAAARL